MDMIHKTNRNPKTIDMCLPFSKDWLRLASGVVIMANFNKIPKLVSVANPSHLTMEQVKSYNKVVSENQLHQLPSVPTQESLGPIIREMDNVGCDIVFMPSIGFIMKEAVPFLTDVSLLFNRMRMRTNASGSTADALSLFIIFLDPVHEGVCPIAPRCPILDKHRASRRREQGT
jgi:hypothetical protein